MKIIHLVLGKANPNKGNGVNKLVHFLATSQMNAGYDVEVWGITHNANVQHSHNYTLRLFKSSRFRFLLSRNFNKNLDSLKQECIFVLHSVFIPELYMASLYIRKYGYKYIHMPHDPYSKAMFGDRKLLKKLYWLLCEKKLLQNSSAIQTLDIRHNDLLKKLGISSRFISFPNGFNESDNISEDELLFSKTGRIKCFYLGRLDIYNKGLDLLIEAFNNRDVSNIANLVIQGVGDLSKIRSIINKFKLRDIIRVLPANFSTPPTSLIKNYNIFCLPSRFEGFGLAAMEAMLAARVILVSEDAGIAKHIEKCGCGVLVQPQVNSIINGILKLSAIRSEWKKMGLAGRAYALQHFSMAELAKKIAIEYELVCK
ncbi:MAG: glycosyltransferase [Deltaproteobacteria bacterium]|nr:glycosyltransferase [Deltaproteobacteria bacterium]